jgi:hypothetical protein
MPAARSAVPAQGQPRGALVGVFIATVAVFLISIAFIFAQDWIPNSNRYFEFILLPAAGLLTILGAVLVVLAARARLARGLKTALVLTGSSALGIPLCAILHNVVYGLMILIFGEGFWERSNAGDEGFFFILALIVLPIVLLVSAAFCTVLLLRASRSRGT